MIVGIDLSPQFPFALKEVFKIVTSNSSDQVPSLGSFCLKPLGSGYLDGRADFGNRGKNIQSEENYMAKRKKEENNWSRRDILKAAGAVGGSLLAQNSLAAVPTAEKPLAGMIEMHVHNEKN